MSGWAETGQGVPKKSHIPLASGFSPVVPSESPPQVPQDLPGCHTLQEAVGSHYSGLSTAPCTADCSPFFCDLASPHLLLPPRWALIPFCVCLFILQALSSTQFFFLSILSHRTHFITTIHVLMKSNCLCQPRPYCRVPGLYTRPPPPLRFPPPPAAHLIKGKPTSG